MKKSVFALMFAALMFVACGGKQEAAPVQDEAAVEAVDSTVVEGDVVEEGVAEEAPAADELQDAPVQE